MDDSHNPSDIFTERRNYAYALSWVIEFVSSQANQNGHHTPSPEHVKSLHGISASNLVEEAGSYRTRGVTITNSPYKPPPPDDVAFWMDDFFATLHNNWNNWTSTQIAAYALWRLNWIHPFPNGNGRTARLYSYMLLNLKIGRLIHGKRGTLIPEVIGNLPYRRDYIDALRQADEANDSDKLDLSQMENLISKMLFQQLAASY